MAEIWIWNSQATRRRALTDTVKDAGLNIIKTYLKKHNHRVRIVDWVEPDFFRKLSPAILVKINRSILKALFYLAQKSNRKSILLKPLGALSLFVQGFLSNIQKSRMEARLKLFVQEIISSGVKIIGVKLWYGEAFSWSKKLVELLKESAPEILTIAGGYHATLYEEDVLKYSDFDLGVVCEGEFALKEILDIVDSFKAGWDKKTILKQITEKAENTEIKNLIYRINNEIKKTPRYDYTKTEKTIPDYETDKKINFHVVIESLGCDWAKCNFCVHPYFYPRYFIRPPEQVVDEMEIMLKKGIGIFRFSGSDTPPAFGVKIAERILDKGLNVEYSMFGRGMRNAKDPQVYSRIISNYSLMIKSGLRAVFIGGECGNDLINLEVMNKGVTAEDLIYTARALREAEKTAGKKIDLSLALIYPAPLLNKVAKEKVFADNLRLVKEMGPDSVMITPPGPFKNTKWFLQKEEFGFSFSEGIVKTAMEYEYVLYKPPYMWPDLGFSLEGAPFKDILSECNSLRREIEEKLQIPTDITDEEFLLMRAAGYQDKSGVLKFKKESLLDIVSCDYDFIDKAGEKLNQHSLNLAKSNMGLE